MCWLMKTCRPTLRATAFLRWAPTARIEWQLLVEDHGPRRPAPRATQQPGPSSRRSRRRCRPRGGRSVGRERGRDRPRRRVCRTASRSSVQIGSSLRFPLVATTGKSKRVHEASRWSGSVGQHDPQIRVVRGHALVDRGPGPPGQQDDGSLRPRREALPPHSSVRHKSRAAARSRTINGQGFLASAAFFSRKPTSRKQPFRGVRHQVEAAQSP